MKWLLLWFGLAFLGAFVACLGLGIFLLVKSENVFQEGTAMRFFDYAMTALVGAAIATGFFGTIQAVERR